MNALASVRPVFRAVVVTVVPEANHLDESSWQELETLVESTLHDRPPSMVRQLRLFLRLIQWLTVFRYGNVFTSLSAARRTQVLSYLQNCPIQLIRCGFWGLRTLAFVGFYGRPAATQAIGYRPDLHGWEAIR